MKEKIKTVVHKARKQPVHIRRQLALWATVCCTLLIVVVWILTFQFSIPRSKEPNPAQNTSSDTAFSPFRVVKNAFEGFSLKSDPIINEDKQK